MEIQIDRQKLDSRQPPGTITFEGTMFLGILGTTYMKEHKAMPTGEFYDSKPCSPKTKYVKLDAPVETQSKPECWILRNSMSQRPHMPKAAQDIRHELKESCGCDQHYNSTSLEYKDAEIVLMYQDNPNFPHMDMQTLGDFDIIALPNSDDVYYGGYKLAVPKLPLGTPWLWQGTQILLDKLGVKIVGMAASQ